MNYKRNIGNLDFVQITFLQQNDRIRDYKGKSETYRECLQHIFRKIIHNRNTSETLPSVIFKKIQLKS